MFSGPTNARIMVVGEAPGEEEERLNRPFVGAAGWAARGMFKEAGLNFDECFVCNVTDKRPPHNNIEAFFSSSGASFSSLGRTYNIHIKEGLEQLYSFVNTIKPQLIITLGGTSLWALTGKEGITKWRGSQLKIVVAGTPIMVLPTLHPAAILRAWGDRWIAVQDLRRAKRLLDGTIRKNTWSMEICHSIEQALKWMDGTTSDEIVVDLETRGNEIATVGLGYGDSAISIPILSDHQISGHWEAHDEAYLISEIRRFLKQHKCIFHNALFDLYYLACNWGFTVDCFMDTMIAHHVCFPGEGIGGKQKKDEKKVPIKGKSLDFIASLYCEDYCYWKDHGESIEELMPYNCEDILRTWECAQVLKQVAHDLNLEKAVSFQVSLVPLFLQTMLRGVRIDPDAIQGIANEIGKQQEDYLLWFEKILGHHFNPKSNKQLMALMYKDFNLRPVIKDNRMTCNEDALKKLAKREPLLRPLIDRIIEYNQSVTFRSNFLKSSYDEDNRLRCSYNLTGAETFRTSSSENPTGTGMNLQNIPGEPKWG